MTTLRTNKEQPPIYKTTGFAGIEKSRFTHKDNKLNDRCYISEGLHHLQGIFTLIREKHNPRKDYNAVEVSSEFCINVH